MSSSLIVPLKEAFDIKLVGGKAINLAGLMKANLPVPDGFVVSTLAFEAAAGGKVSEDLAAQIKEAFEALGADLTAARSSATAEDMAGASMAGQYETYLNLASVEEVIEGIEKCWKSISSQRTTAYLKEHGIEPEDVAMAVVIQKQVKADVAGVLFTADPQSGSRDKMLIEASWGLGEGLVSGEVQPDLISIHSRKEMVNFYQVADKKQAMFPGKKGFTPVEENKRKKACLPYEQIMQLQQLGQLAEKHFGYPQDIEWAVESSRVYMLQARPITTLEEVDAYNSLINKQKAELEDLEKQGNGPWVRHNLGETLPHPTPFTWQLVSHFMSGDGGFGQMHKELGFVPGPAVSEGKSFLKRLGGEIYMDCSLMTEMFFENYPYAYDPDVLRANPDAAQNPPTVPNGSMKQINEAAQQSIAVSKKLGQMAVKLDKDFDEKFIPEVLEWSESQARIDLSKLSDDELVDLWNNQKEKVMNDFGNTAFMPSMVEALAVENLRSFLVEHSWNEDPHELLSVLAVSAVPDSTIRSNIELAQLAVGTMNLKNWLEKHGHRAPGEFELATPRWTERPDDVLLMADQMKGDKKLAEIHHNRIKLAEERVSRLKSEMSSTLFKDLQCRVDLVQRYCRFREDGKYYLMKAYSALRNTALEFGRRLELGADVFFLTHDEVYEALKTGFVSKDKIIQRKLEYKVEKRIQFPHVIDAENIQLLGSAPVRNTGKSLEAHSVSNGVCTGTVAIVKSPEEVSELPKGAILVCPSTDPSWTPLFVNASGLVLERGGSLSHGAVVAREMGLPALVLDGATEILEEGELITVDANSARIYREGACAESNPGEDTVVRYSMVPPPVSSKEKKANQLGVLVAVLWGLFLAAVYLLPEQVLHNPLISLIDSAIWPLIRNLGMIWTVAVIAVLFALIPIIMQKYLTDNRRLFEGKKRSAALLKEAKGLAVDSPRRKKLEELAAPLTMRVLRASMVPLAFILGPMMMIFMWFPDRVDPLSWSSKPGRMVSIVAEVDGDTAEDIVLEVAPALSINGARSQKKTLPPIRKELEELRSEWRSASDMDGLPWEVQSAGDHTRNLMMASLNSFLSEKVPPQKVTWLVSVPETAEGAHPVKMSVGKNAVADFKLVFGAEEAPFVGTVLPKHESLKSVTVNYPRALQKGVFWAPLAMIGGPAWDFGWLGVYLLVYLPLMFAAKLIFKVP